MKRITTLLAGLLLSAASHAEVAECYSWQPDAGKTAATLQTMQEAAAIHEKLGAAVGIYQINVAALMLITACVGTTSWPGAHPRIK